MSTLPVSARLADAAVLADGVRPRPWDRIGPVVIALANVALAFGLGLLIANDAVLGFAIVLLVLGAILLLTRPGVATIAVIAILYSNAAAIATRIHGVPLVVAGAFPLLLIIPLVYYLVIRREPLLVTTPLRLIVALFFAELIGTILSRDPLTASGVLLTFAIEGVALFFLVTNVVRDLTMLRRAVWVLVIVGGSLGWLSGYQQASGELNQDFLGFAQVSNAVLAVGETAAGDIVQHRLAGPIGEKNRYAQILIVLLPLAFTRIWDERSRLLRLLAIVCAAGIGTGVALTFSRGAALGFGITVVIMVVLRYIPVRQLLALVLAGVVFLAAFPSYAARLTTLEDVPGATASAGQTTADTAIRGRATEGLAAALAFIDFPIFGTGPGLFPSYYRHYANDIAIRIEHTDREAHNLYLDRAAQTGIVGLVLFLAIVGVIFRDLSRARRRWLDRRPDLANMATGFALALVTYLTTGLFLHLSFERYYWLLIGLATMAAWIALHTPDDEPPPSWSRAAGRREVSPASVPTRPASLPTGSVAVPRASG